MDNNNNLEKYINLYRDLYLLEKSIDNFIRFNHLPQDLQNSIEVVQYLLDEVKQTVLDNLRILAFSDIEEK